MKQTLESNKIIKWVILLGDLVLLNVVFVTSCHLFGQATLGERFFETLPQIVVSLNLLYLIVNSSHGVVLHERVVRPEQIVRKAVRCVLLHSLFFIALVMLTGMGTYSALFYIVFYTLFFILLTIYRLLCRKMIRIYRKRGGNLRTVVLVGNNLSMIELYEAMTKDDTVGYRVAGYFSDTPSANYPAEVPYWGIPGEVPVRLEQCDVDLLYCGISSSREKEIMAIINYCENHMIRFYSVPNIRNFLHRRMTFRLFDSVPMFAIREEPLSKLENRIVKRVFDVVFSGLFLCTLFPLVYIIIGIAIKLSSPGPILFRQKRSGRNGEDFWCYKFRSMRVNVDSDTLQATEHDPRKTRIGDFIRRTSIDELPQFINVFRGDMSVVGPRPHMLKHTEEYGKIISKYMVRHYIKPGVTGWAQVTGFRGETKELWQMEGRVKRDVWYIENWTFLLDLYIIYKTVRNAAGGEKNAY